jgi:hypothetical protein
MARKQKWLTCWVPHRLELLLSPAWQLAPRPLKRVLERLEIEHMRHGGLNNGHLYVSFDQFVAYRLSRKIVKPTLTLGTALGLLEVIQDEEAFRGDIRPSNRYRLTYVPAKNAASPTDEWKAVSEAKVEAALDRFRSETITTPKAAARVAA